MNPRKVFLISSVLLFIISLGVIAQDKYIPKENEELYGTWTNEQYSDSISYQAQKMVVTADGYGWYHMISDSVTYEEGRYEIDSKWTDAEGNIWYRIFCTATTGNWKDYKGQWLIELSKSATVWECTWTFLSPSVEFDPAYWPKEINRSVWSHNIRYRTAE